MKTVILAGGVGSRLAEETELRPKPMVEIGDEPILLHIMRHYSHFGFEEFIVALGYKGDVVKRYFLDYMTLHGDMTFDLAAGRVERRDARRPDWRVHLIDTGKDVLTGGRVRRLKGFLGGERFMVTYGDGVANIDIAKLVEFHGKHGRIGTITAVRPPARFGGIVLDGDLVSTFAEKPQTGEGWVNGGFMVFEPGIFDYLEGDMSSLESSGLATLAADGQLVAFRHGDFWQCMDTLRDKYLLESLWRSGDAPWKLW